MSEAIKDAVDNMQEEMIKAGNGPDDELNQDEIIVDTGEKPEEITAPTGEEGDKPKDDEQEGAKPPETKEGEDKLPAWATEMKNDLDYDVANMLATGNKAEWLTKGFDKFTEEEKESFGKMHSKWDKHKNEEEKLALEEKQQQTPQPQGEIDHFQQQGYDEETIKRAQKTLNDMEKYKPELYRQLNNLLEASPNEFEPAEVESAPLDLSEIKKKYLEAVGEEDDEKAVATFDDLAKEIASSVKKDILSTIDKKEENKAEQDRRDETITIVKGWYDEINQIRASGDRRIEKYLQKGEDGATTIGRLMESGDSRSGKRFKSVHELYGFLLGEDRDGRGQDIPKPDFGALPSKGGEAFDENQFEESQEELRKMTTKEYMEKFPGL